MIVVRPQVHYRKPVPGVRVFPGHALSRGLVGYWPMNEAAGATLMEASGKRTNINGTLNSPGTGQKWEPGNFGTAIAFDGLNGNVTVPDYAEARFTADMTVSCWIRTRLVQSNTGIVAKWTGNTGWTLVTHIASQVIFQVDDAANRAIAGITDAVWNHIVCVRSGTTIYVYINGIEGGTDTVTTLTSTTRVIEIGSYNDTLRFDGKIDNVLLYDRALSVAEIRQLYINPFVCLIPKPGVRLNSTAVAAAALFVQPIWYGAN